jgi:heme/copper-type cytochrome/quinol oxidase subunit 3
MSSRRLDLDVSELPSVVLGHRDLTFWATLGFIVIEGFTLLLASASYFYLRQNQFEWPPAPTPLPDLLLPTINAVLILLVMVPMKLAGDAARRFDPAGAQRWLIVATLMSVPPVILRWFDLTALNVRWDSNAYGSAAWGVVVLHSTLLVTDLFETGVLAAIFITGRAQKKSFTDTTDATLYQYFLSLSWLVLYFILYWSPRLI